MSNITPATRYHESADVRYVTQGWATPVPGGAERPIDLLQQVTDYRYDFQNFSSPFVGQLITQLNNSTHDPIADMLDPGFLTNLNPFLVDPLNQFKLLSPNIVNIEPYLFDVDPSLPYANYHWELGFHLLHAIADVHLSNGRPDEALAVLRYILDLSSTDNVPGPAKFWKFLYFRLNPNGNGVASILATLSDPNASQQARDAIIKSYTAAMTTPFQPFAVARARTICFQYFTVMKLLDCYLAKADSLLTEPMTIERVNEATQWVVQAANLLGPRPQQVPKIGTTIAISYDGLGSKTSRQNDPLGDALVDLEGQFPFNLTTANATPSSGMGPLLGMGRTLYFCIPEDQALLGYWDTVEDRLHKIRNCENLAGRVQLMPLFDPLIDPGLLVAATAAGLDIAAAIAGLNQPISAVRTPTLIRKALDMASEVRTLGNELLAALEKRDAEHLALLRQTNDTNLQEFIIDTRTLQHQQTLATSGALLAQQQSAYERYSYYMHLQGQSPAGLPKIDTTTTITKDNFGSAYQQLVTNFSSVLDSPARSPYSTFVQPQSAAPSTQAGATNPGPLYLSSYEDVELNQKMPEAANDQVTSENWNHDAAHKIATVPTVGFMISPFGVGTSVGPFGGEHQAEECREGAASYAAKAAAAQGDAARAGKMAAYQRRADEWTSGLNNAAMELQAVGKQLLTSIITQQAAAQELSTAQQQQIDSQNVLDYMKNSMFTNEDLYIWMQGQLLTHYQKYYQFATDLARKAEATAKWELRRPELDVNTYIQPSYFNSTWHGLTAGDALTYDIKRLEADYDNYNLRELELTQHVSLRRLDPLALLNLTITGSCMLSIPEWFYDVHCPGHYMRRIKTVAVSVPCVPGPYTHVNCTATLQNSTIRTSPTLPGSKSYDRIGTDDPRFSDYYGAPDSIVTSSGQADSGMFETNLRDDRFLPFEGVGAISTWTLTLPPVRTFDYGTITDVMLHIRYTARDGGGPLGGPATVAVTKQLSRADGASGQALLFCLRYDFPTEWFAFAGDPNNTADFSATISRQHFPYVVQNSKLTVDTVTLYAADSTGKTIDSYAPTIDLTQFNSSINKPDLGQATLPLSPDPNGILTRSPNKQVFLVLGYHFQYPT
jgi:hypothetical protein